MCQPVLAEPVCGALYRESCKGWPLSAMLPYAKELQCSKLKEGHPRAEPDVHIRLTLIGHLYLFQYKQLNMARARLFVALPRAFSAADMLSILSFHGTS